MSQKITYQERVYWNKYRETYGKAIIVPKKGIKMALVALCLATPGTNWLILFINRIQDIRIAWGG